MRRSLVAAAAATASRQSTLPAAGTGGQKLGGRVTAVTVPPAAPVDEAWRSRGVSSSSLRRVAATPATRRPAAAVGTRLLEVETPALVVDLEALEGNIKKLVEIMEKYPVALRPHAKTHKTLEVAHLQLQHKPQMVGVCVQNVSEALAMAETARDVLLSNEVASAAKARRMATLARRGITVSAVVDSSACAEMLALAARVEGTRLGVLIEVNVGQNRCGVDTPTEAVTLAEEIKALEELQFRGIQAYHGCVQHQMTYAERLEASRQAAGRAKAVAEALKDAGFSCDVITGGGPGTLEMDAASNVFTELQPSSYVFSDTDYWHNPRADGKKSTHWTQSLFVAATVVSCNEASRRVVLDVGTKAVSYDSGPPRVHGLPEDRVKVENGGDEHTILYICESERLPRFGEQVLLVPGHCDRTVNVHDHMVASRDMKTVEAIWQVAARGPGI